ncbi:MAG: DUF4197 domain-containing protein [Bacteroidetes bacterium]|nr:DUF4197 domain-containing protein [Bacteroidota bacterium]
MKIKSLIVGLFCLLTITSCDTLKQIGSDLLKPSNLEMALGLKEALNQGLFKTFDAYSNPASNPALAFAFPNDAQKIINLANQAGLGSIIKPINDKFNKAIANSFSAAKPIFLNAVKSMNISDVANILITDNTHAATDYFRTTTNTALMNAFRPIIDSTINVEGANKEWKKIASIVNNIPFSSFKVENSLTDFVAARAVEGMYNMVAEEEKNIRTNLNFRKSDLTKKVFNYADEELKKRAVK